MNTGTSEDVIRVSIVGPECTGKSELAQFLAQHYQTKWVPEFARAYLETINRPYTKDDLTHIAKWQLVSEDELALSANKVLICDTDLFVIKIWSEYKYNFCDPLILENLNNRKYNLHLLTYVDIPWEEDPQREHPHKRLELYDIYWKELTKASRDFIEIKGTREERRETAINAIDKLLNGHK